MRHKIDYSFGFRFFFSSLHIAIAMMFGLSMIFWPRESFPGSYDIMFDFIPKPVYGLVLSSLPLMALIDYLKGKERAWKRVNIFLGLTFTVLMSVFVVPGSITGVTTYFCCAACSFLHGFGGFMSVGYESETPTVSGRSKMKSSNKIVL